jgi:hypothetical protein
MNPLNPFESRLRFRKLTAGLLSAAILWASPLVAAPANQSQSAKTNSLRSVFILPANPREGRDPFFPKSNRPYEAAMTATNSTVEATALVVKGVSGTSDHRLVIINNHTFAAGDTADVITDRGRIRVHCVEIKPHSVVIEIGNQYHELPLSDNL